MMTIELMFYEDNYKWSMQRARTGLRFAFLSFGDMVTS